MLVLTRGRNQSIFIGEEIEVRVASIEGNKVRLAIRAPQGVPIDREEVRIRKIRNGHMPAPRNGAPQEANQATLA